MFDDSSDKVAPAITKYTSANSTRLQQLQEMAEIEGLDFHLPAIKQKFFCALTFVIMDNPYSASGLTMTNNIDYNFFQYWQLRPNPELKKEIDQYMQNAEILFANTRANKMALIPYVPPQENVCLSSHFATRFSLNAARSTRIGAGLSLLRK